MKVRIRAGARVGQDFRVYIWPMENVDVDKVFEGSYYSNLWHLKAEGFGITGSYGNGAILVHNKEDVVEVTKHKWYDVIVAWAEGKPIQYRYNTESEWIDEEHPNPPWAGQQVQFRVKPDTKIIYIDTVNQLFRVCKQEEATLKLTYMNNQLESVEML